MMMRYLVSLMFILFLTGCGVYSQHPITSFDKRQMDKRLFGSWFWLEKEESGYIHIGVDGKSNLLKVLMVDINENGEMSFMEFEGHASHVGKNHYLNLKLIQPAEDRISGYMFVKYSVSSNILNIGLMDSEIIVKATEKGTLKGEVKRETFSKDIYLSESGEVLQKFILKHDQALFPEMKSLRKVDLHKLK